MIMISERELITTISTLTEDALRRWIALGWIVPVEDDQTVLFDTVDVARVRLISELHFDLDIEEDTLTMVLSLLDQLYAVRRSLSAVMAAVAAQPDDVRVSIATLVEAQRGFSAERRE
jgi:chaperone modulatory protein CbpM